MGSAAEYIGDNSIDSLIHRVEEFEIISQLKTIDRLTAENSLLYQLIVAYRKRWFRTMDLLERSQYILATLQEAFRDCVKEEIAAERDWLAFWGIRRDHVQLPKYSPGGWI